MYDNGSRGWVYFIVCEMTQRVKIGWAGHPGARLDAIKFMGPTILKVAAAYRGTPLDERETHGRFAKHRLHGEWFNLADEIKAEIQSVVEKEGVAPWDPPPEPPKPQPGSAEYEEMLFNMKRRMLESIGRGEYRWGKNDLRLYGDILFGIKEPEIPFELDWMRP